MIERIVRDISIPLYENPKDILEKLNYFRELSKNGLHVLSEGEIASLKANFTKFFNVTLGILAPAYPTKLFRLTNNKHLCDGKTQKLQNISKLLGPPDGLSNLGRCNLAGESVFYSALDFRTVIWEMQPKPGDYITVSQWKIKEEQHLNMHSIFHPKETILNKESLKAYEAFITLKEEFDPQIAVCIDEILQFICEEFMKPVEIDKRIDYLFSAIISSSFLQAKPDQNGFKVDAISYPSIKRDYGVTNLAVANSVVLEKLDLENITLYMVGKTNYDSNDKEAEDFFKISGIQYKVTDFDFVNNKIIYNKTEELRLLTEWIDKVGIDNI